MYDQMLSLLGYIRCNDLCLKTTQDSSSSRLPAEYLADGGIPAVCGLRKSVTDVDPGLCLGIEPYH